MNTQQLPYVRGSDTSEAAAAHASLCAETKKGQILACIARARAFGATDDEIQRRLGMSGNTERPRRVELLKAGLIKASKQRRATLGGDLAVVWVAV